MVSKIQDEETKEEVAPSFRYAVIQPLAPLAILMLIILLFFWRMVFTDLILARGDTFLYFYPNWSFAREALLAGRLPQWNPHIFLGAPFIANSQVGFFYPLNWPLWLLFEVPDAVKITLVAHLIWAAVGTYQLARLRFELSELTALLVAVLFVLGGYLTAQVEHVNQLQGLAWFPWLLLVCSSPFDASLGGRGRPAWGGTLLLVSAIFAMQLLAGHTQSLLICGIGAGVYLISFYRFNWHLLLVRLTQLALGGLIALSLAAAQLLPTLELTGLSSRQGGLSINEVLSFSLNPLLLGQSLLPFIDQTPFTEYVAFVPASALLLALYAALTSIVWFPQADDEGKGASAQPHLAIRVGLALTVIGLFLALGRFNLISVVYSRLPGFDLFRVPARWLFLYGFGISLLAGAGFEILFQRAAPLRWPLMGGALTPLVLLIGWRFVTPWLSGIVPVGPESPVESPSLFGTAILLAEIGLVILLLFLRDRDPRFKLRARFALLVISLGVLFVTSRQLPYHNLTTREAYFDQRSPGLRLLVKQNEASLPSRFLSLSQIFFDPGDQAEIDTIYADHLTPAGAYDYTIAIKLKEIMAPNLPMMRGLHAVDGFDGGVLPLRAYSEFMSRTLLDGQITTDGRLREFLDTIPDEVWLDRLGVRFVITDKVGDSWIDGVFFDRQHRIYLADGDPLEIGYLPQFEADQIQVIFEGERLNALVNGDLITGQPLVVEGDFAGILWGIDLPEANRPTSISFFGEGTLQAASLVNQTQGTFQALVPGAYRQIYSGDVKIYENLDAHEAAVLLPAGSRSLETEGAISGAVEEVISYSPQEIVLNVNAAEPSTLVYLSAAYPGWQGFINGEPAELVSIDRFLIGLDLPPGEHEITFRFHSLSLQRGIFISAVLWMAWGGLFVIRGRFRTG